MILRSAVIMAIMHFCGSAFAADGPVYLYTDDGVGIYTPVVSQDNHIAHRSVTQEEISNLKALGYEIRVINTKPPKNHIARVEHGGSGSASTISTVPSDSSLPSDFTIIYFNGNAYGNFYVPSTQSNGNTTQWASFYYASSGIAGVPLHLAVSLLLDSDQLTGSYPPANAPQVVGNGIIIGASYLLPTGCGYGGNTAPIYNAQVESFWNGGNYLFQDSCSATGFADGTTYGISIGASTSGWVQYRIVDGSTSWWSPSEYTAPYRPAGQPGSLNGTGLLFTLVPNPNVTDTTERVMYFNQAGTGWF